MIAFHWVVVFVVWWLGVAASPIMTGPLDGREYYYPLATAMAALATAQSSRDSPAPTAGMTRRGCRICARIGSRACSRFKSSVLAILAVLFTRGETSAATVASARSSPHWRWHGGASHGMGRCGIRRKPGLGIRVCDRRAPGRVAAGSERRRPAVDLRRRRRHWPLRSCSGSSAGILRRDGSPPSAGSPARRGRAKRSRFASHLRSNGLRFGVDAHGRSRPFSCAGLRPEPALGMGESRGVALLMAAAALLVHSRAALEATVAGVSRPGHDPGGVCRLPDGVSLADRRGCGCADVARLSRPGPGRASRPAEATRSTPDPVALHVAGRCRCCRLLQLLWIGGTNEVALFHLLAAATFYSVACGQMRWKSLGYAAGVLYNAALWVLWSIFGWKLSDHFQFFMVPVGFSTILFAESQRHELGRSTVNSIRSAGLMMIYASLAVPIWQFASFGAWLTLLVASLDRYLPRHRPSPPDIPLAGPGHIRPRRCLRDGPREPRPRNG